MKFEKKKFLGIIGVLAALFGLLVLPILLQKYVGISAIKTTFAVIILYAVLNYYYRSR